MCSINDIINVGFSITFNMYEHDVTSCQGRNTFSDSSWNLTFRANSSTNSRIKYVFCAKYKYNANFTDIHILWFNFHRNSM